MPTDKFSSSWINLREPYDSISRSSLLLDLYRKDANPFNNIIDLGGGNGSFLRWCHSQSINYNKFMLIDHDQSLLKNFYSKTKKLFSKSSIDLIKESPTSYKFKRLKKDKINYIILKQLEILKSIAYINDYNIISFSAVSDLLSKTYIKKILNKIDKDKIIYFSICFDGTVRWKNINKYDKYIISLFNKHQQKEKTLGFALGSKSIQIVKNLSLKKGFKCHIADSSWNINSDTNNARTFQLAYLDTIYKPLKKYELVDQVILKQWFKLKKEDIKNKKSRLTVGHKDIIILT